MTLVLYHKKRLCRTNMADS